MKTHTQGKAGEEHAEGQKPVEQLKTKDKEDAR